MMRQLLTSHATFFQQSCPHAHFQNGVVERKHQHILNTAHYLQFFSYVPPHFGVKAILTISHTINITPSFVIYEDTPFFCLLSSSRYELLHVFGCRCYIFLHPHERSNLELYTALYVHKQHGYHCYDPISHRICISCHIDFDENSILFPCTPHNLSFLLTTSLP